MDAANIDLKGFSEGFYKNLCSGRTDSVLETLEYLKHETNVWFEITTLLIPGENENSLAEIEAESAWVMDRLGPDVPLFTAFRPGLKLTTDTAGDAARGATDCNECRPSVRLHRQHSRSRWPDYPLSRLRRDPHWPRLV